MTENELLQSAAQAAPKKRAPTKEQQAAIDTRDKTLVVSAAAGAGKTMTLTSRVIASILDEKDPVSLSELLIVTFTNAAAEEVRERITAALKKAAQDSFDKIAAIGAAAKNASRPLTPAEREEITKQEKTAARLEGEVLAVRDAKIRTIDAFCTDVLRANADAAGISPAFRIADTAEISLLSSSLMEDLIAEVYEGLAQTVASPAEFKELADCLVSSKTDKDLSETLLHLYGKCSGQIGGIAVLRDLIGKFDPEAFTAPGDTPFGARAFLETKEWAADAAATCKAYAEELQSGDDAERKYAATPTDDAAQLSSLAKAKTFGEMRDMLTRVTFSKAVTVPKDKKTDAILAFAALRDKIKKACAERFADYFSLTDDEWRALFAGLFRKGGTLFRFLEAYDERFSAEKRRLAIADFADLEQLAYRCLWQDGEKTPLARSLADGFRAVYIDEYQDVNELQNKIFEAVSKEDDRFLVGDIKQCIYCFRGAVPEIFAKMKAAYPPLDEARAAGAKAASLFLAKNFRTDEALLTFANEIFDRIFPLACPALGHTALDRLIAGKEKTDAVPEVYPEIHILRKPSDCDVAETPPDEVADEMLEEDLGTYEAEAETVARKIRALLDEKTRVLAGEELKPKHVAILMRDAAGVAPLYAEALARAGIPAKISGARAFFLNPEVLLAVSLLGAIDNPKKDVYLAGLMASPLYGFTPSELVKIRRAGGETLYDALKTYKDATPCDEKAQKFLSALNRYRKISEGLSVDVLIAKLYRETGLLALAAKNGGKDNLILLHDFAKKYEATSFKGLYSFMGYLDDVIKKDLGPETDAEGSVSDDAVTILTAHKSKGLEFPVVFVVSAGRAFRNKDAKDRVVIAPEFGVSFREKTPNGLALVENPVHAALLSYLRERTYEEELRILYVALTRAQNRLYVYGTPSTKDADGWLAAVRDKLSRLSPFAAKNLSSFLEIALLGDHSAKVFVEDPKTPAKTGDTAAPCVDFAEDPAALALREGGEAVASLPEKEGRPMPSAEDFYKRFTYDYPDKILSTLPEKLSVSTLSPSLLDEDGKPERTALTLEDYDRGAIALPPDEEKAPRPTQPAFMAGKSADESARRGIATHQFLQFCDFEALAKDGEAAVLESLTAAGFLSSEDADRVRLDEIQRFRGSPLFGKILAAERAKKPVYREQRFHVFLPARLFTGSEERKTALGDRKILVQGVIDCLFEDEKGDLHLVDYKTDRLPKAALADADLARRILSEKHSRQLSYYAKAVAIMFGKAPATVTVYSLHLGDEVDVEPAFGE